MPEFSRVRITTHEPKDYERLMDRLVVGHKVALPLSEGDSSIMVMRYLNQAAQNRDFRLQSTGQNENGELTFKVIPLPAPRSARVTAKAATKTRGKGGKKK